MALKFNPLTGQFDLVNPSGSGSGATGATGPTGPTGPAGGGGGGEPLSNGQLPFPELLFDEETGDVLVAG